MTETKFKCAAVKLIHKELAGAWCYHPSDKWISGIPDLIICYKGTFSAIELKVGRNKPSKLQIVTLGRIGEAGGITAVCWTLEEVRRVIEKIRLREVK